MFFLHLLSADYVERVLYTNELLSLFGLLFLISKPSFSRADVTTKYVLAFIVLCTLIFIYSLSKYDSTYFLLRNSVIFYSTFSYFVGYRLYNSFNYFSNSIRKPARVLFLSILFFPSKYFLTTFVDRFSGASIIPGLFKNKTRLFFIIVLIATYTFGTRHESSTTLIFLVLLIPMLFIKKYFYFKIGVVAYFLSILILLFYFQDNFKLIEENYSYLDNEVAIYRVINSHWLLSVDPNTTWRFILWWQVIFTHFPENIIGLGFGTPMFEYFPIADFNKLKELPYLMSAHNTYISIFGRTGILGFVIIISIILSVFKDYFKNKAYYINNNLTFLFLIYLSIIVIGMFNILIETPIYACLFWILTGLCARAIIERKKQNESSTNT